MKKLTLRLMYTAEIFKSQICSILELDPKVISQLALSVAVLFFSKHTTSLLSQLFKKYGLTVN